MRRADFSATSWEDRVFALLASHPDTVTVADARHLDPSTRNGVDGLWKIADGDRTVEVPFSVHVAAPGSHQVRFETATLRGRARFEGSAFSEAVRIAFVCSPHSHAMVSLPGHALRDFLRRHDEYPRSTVSIGGDARDPVRAELVAVPVTDLMRIPEATISTPESW